MKNQSLKEHITLRIFDDRKSLGPQTLNLPRAPKFLCAALGRLAATSRQLAWIV